MTNCKNQSKNGTPTPNQTAEKYCSSCPTQPKFVKEDKTCHPLTSYITPSFSDAREFRTPFDLYWLYYYNQHAEKTDYNFPLIKQK